MAIIGEFASNDIREDRSKGVLRLSTGGLALVAVAAGMLAGCSDKGDSDNTAHTFCGIDTQAEPKTCVTVDPADKPKSYSLEDLDNLEQELNGKGKKPIDSSNLTDAERVKDHAKAIVGGLRASRTQWAENNNVALNGNGNATGKISDENKKTLGDYNREIEEYETMVLYATIADGLNKSYQDIFDVLESGDLDKIQTLMDEISLADIPAGKKEKARAIYDAAFSEKYEGLDQKVLTDTGLSADKIKDLAEQYDVPLGKLGNPSESMALMRDSDDMAMSTNVSETYTAETPEDVRDQMLFAAYANPAVLAMYMGAAYEDETTDPGIDGFENPADADVLLQKYLDPEEGSEAFDADYKLFRDALKAAFDADEKPVIRGATGTKGLSYALIDEHLVAVSVTENSNGNNEKIYEVTLVMGEGHEVTLWVKEGCAQLFVPLPSAKPKPVAAKPSTPVVTPPARPLVPAQPGGQHPKPPEPSVPPTPPQPPKTPPAPKDPANNPVQPQDPAAGNAPAVQEPGTGNNSGGESGSGGEQPKGNEYQPSEPEVNWNS